MYVNSFRVPTFLVNCSYLVYSVLQITSGSHVTNILVLRKQITKICCNVTETKLYLWKGGKL